jgi:hypothetical protein
MGLLALNRSAAAGFRQQHIQDAFFGHFPGFSLHGFLRADFQLVNGQFQQIPDHGFHVPAHVSHLCELGGLHLVKGRVSEAGQAPGDLGLANTRGADENDVFGRDLVAQVRLHVAAPPPVAQGDGNGALGMMLADNVPVEFRNYLQRL